MPTISMFYGVIVRMCDFDNQQHNNKPHIHVHYQNDSAVYELPTGETLGGALPPAKHKLVLAWIEIHQESLMADW